MKLVVYSCVFLVSIQGLIAQPGKKESSKYLGEEQPGLIPKIFAKGIVSMENQFEYGSTFSADGKEFYYALNVGKKPEIHFIKFENSAWTKPVKIIGDEKYGYNDPFLSTDGKRLFFISDRALDGKSDLKDIDIWYAERTRTGWSEPVNAGKEINTDKNEYYISFTKGGKMYFSSNGGTTKDTDHDFNIRTSEFVNGKFQPAKTLGDAINSPHYEADVFISSDEKYVIYCSERPDGNGKGDLYISYKNDKGEWQPSRILGAAINTAAYEFCPFVTSDGKFFFFSRGGDIYWVAIEAIHSPK